MSDSMLDSKSDSTPYNMPLPIDIISGFLGAGKTTLIQRLLEGPYRNKRIACIENDFGEVGIDGKLLESAGSTVTEIVSGCICCTLALDFQQAIETLAADPDIERIIIEPSGVAKLSDVMRAVGRVAADTVRPGRMITVVDANTYRSYSEGFGAFYLDQVMNADTLLVSKIDKQASKGTPSESAGASRTAESAAEIVRLLRERNPRAEIVAVPWDSEEFSAFLTTLAAGRSGTAVPPGEDSVSGGHGVNGGNEYIDEDFSSSTLEIEPPTSTEEISRHIENLLESSGEGSTILRIKGIVATSDRGTVRVDWAGGVLSFESTDVPPENRLVIIEKGV